MNGSSSIGTALARVFLFPGDIACTAMGLESDDKRELVRMLVNSLVWIVLGMVAAVVLT
ncbi:MAG TPA: hypothetical protein VG270_03280 [Pseudolabrys sp.]|nr:hypothetical protein [Pseudolabrys sp.]